MPLISDANVIIDMQEGGILEAMFQLNVSFAVPNTLYEEELEHNHSHLLGLGLEIKVLSGTSVNNAIVLKQQYSSPSMNDLFALELARENDCPLLTGDRALRSAATDEGVELHGTIWLVEQLIREEILTVTMARIAYKKMLDAGSRLPRNDINASLASIVPQKLSGL